MGISACLIAKNEANYIGSCLRSIAPYCDEIIVVDTGSTDATIPIAKSFGATVYNYKWQKDFSAARNFSLDQATEDWILVIDCDEVLCEGCGPLLVDLSHSENIDGFGVMIHNIIGGVDSSVSVSPRFFKNFIHLGFKGIIHENLVDMRTGLPPTGYFLTSKLAFWHYGYENNPLIQEEKTKRNLDLLLSIPDDEKDAMYYLHLGAEYVRLEDMVTAKTIFMKGFHLAKGTEPYFTMLAFKLTDALLKCGDLPTCLSYCHSLLATFPDFRCLYFLKAACHLQQHDHACALHALEMYMSLEEKPFKYPSVPFENINNIPELMDKLMAEIEARTRKV